MPNLTLCDLLSPKGEPVLADNLLESFLTWVEDHHIDFNAIDTITTSGVPLLIRIKHSIEQFRKRKKRNFGIFKNFFLRDSIHKKFYK